MDEWPRPLELERRHHDRYGDGWRGERDGVEGEGGWPLYLKRFAEIAGS
jgi:hypothetical protein